MKHITPPQAAISAAPSGRLWHLRTPASSLIVGVDEEDLLTQRYWGPSLPEVALVEFAETDRGRWNSSFQRPAEIEELLPVDGGHRWGIPSLQVTFAGDVRSLSLEFQGATTTAGEKTGSHELTLSLLDKGYDLAVDLHFRIHDDTDVIERWITLSNQADSAVRVLRADSGNWVIPEQDDYRASTVHGHWAGEGQLERRIVPTGEYTLTSRHGTTGQQSNPWIMIDDGAATETYGEVRTVALAWSGSWRLTTQRRPEGGLSVSGGFGHEGLAWNLAAGSTLTTPSALGLFSDGGFGEATRAWHRYTRRHVIPHPDETRPVLFNSWEATGFDLSEQSQTQLAAKAASIGVELFVVDDGWFGERVTDRAGLGDWFPNRQRFPDGLHGLVAAVRSHGMGFGIWVEPEMVNADSDLYRAHPDWVHHWPDRDRDERRYQLVLNFGRRDVREWATAWLIDLVSTYEVDFLKWDMNRPFTQAGWPEHPDGSDWIWIKHTRGVYEVIDRLRAARPTLRIEACSSGGGRVDLAIMARTDQVWTSDNTDSLDRQSIQNGFSQLYPAQLMGAWVTETVNDMTGRTIPLDYRFHVAMAGNLGIGGDLGRWSESELGQAAEHIAQYKTIRETVQHGDVFRLGANPGHGPSAIQYVWGDQVVLLSYEPHRSLSKAPRRLRLAGLDSESTYLEEGTAATHSGATLMGRGLLFNAETNLRGWNNTRFSTRDYASSLTVLTRVEQ